MTNIASVGFPRMMKEPGERRVFLPEFIQFFAEKGITVRIEEGYGSRSGFTFDDYQLGNPRVHKCSREQAYAQDLVVVLRSPTLDEMQMLKPGTILFSMLHYPTRPRRVSRLHELGVRAISMDSVVDDNNIRMVENMKAVAWNGLETAFDQLEKRWPDLCREDGAPIRSLILGTGMVGKHAVDAATKLGNIERYNEHILHGGNGAVALTVGRSITCNPQQMAHFMREADILVDASQRRDASAPIIPNGWIEWLPDHAVIVDLAVDPYTLSVDPPVVRGVEGIPQGNLNQYIFQPGDPNWAKTVPAEIDSTNRRTTVTCYSWPGIHPEACMRHYGRQLKPLMEALIESGYDCLREEGSYFERALYRATLGGWITLNS